MNTNFKIQVSDNFTGFISVQDTEGNVIFSVNSESPSVSQPQQPTAPRIKYPKANTNTNKNTNPSKYVLDFNKRSTALINKELQAEASYFEVVTVGKEFTLVACPNLTSTSSYIMCPKGGETSSVTFKPDVFQKTGLMSGMRYKVSHTGGNNFLLKPIGQVRYKGEKIKFAYPVVTVSFD